MLALFRRIVKSRVGVLVTLVVLGLIAVLFGLGDVTGLRNGGRVSADALAKVGGEQIGVADLRRDLQAEFENAQARQPGLTMAQFVDAGAVEGVLDREINGMALEQFGRSQRMVVSDRSIGGQLGSIPSLQGPDGKFDMKLYEQLLAQRHLTDAQVRTQIARDLIAQQLIAPTIGAGQVPDRFALPYASALLEKRSGAIGFIPVKAMPAGPAPADAELQTFYARNRIRYLVPERRVVRYALATADTVRAAATPTDAEVAAAFKARAGEFQPAEKRDIEQVVVAGQAAAAALAAKVKGGASIADAARAAGLEARTFKAVTKAAYAGQTSPAVADAAFGAAKGALIGPVGGAIGFVVARVTGVTRDPGKTLEQARPELVKTLAQAKTIAALAKVRDALDEAQSNGANFPEMASREKLAVETTPPLTAQGVDPDDPAYRSALASRRADPKAPAPPAPDPKLAAIAQAAFQAESGDKPSIVPVNADGGFALIALDRVIPAAPRPLAAIRDEVRADLLAERAEAAARTIAGQVIAKVNGGAKLADALAATKLKVEAPKPFSAVRAQASDPQAPGPLKLLFAMQPGKATISEAPGRAGWLVIQLNSVTPGDARGQQAALDQTRAGFRQALGRDYAQQFIQAVQAGIGVTRNPAAIAQLKAELAGRTAPDVP